MSYTSQLQSTAWISHVSFHLAVMYLTEPRKSTIRTRQAMLAELNSLCLQCIKHVGVKEVFVKLTLARILLQSFSYFSCCHQPACNQGWPDGGRSGRLTAVIFPGCQFITGTIIVASSWQSQLPLGYGCPPKSFSCFLPSQPWTVLPAMSLLILPLTRRPALAPGLPDLRPGANRAAWNPWFPDSHSCLGPHYLLTVWRISWISFPLLQCVAWLVFLRQILSLRHVLPFQVLISARLALSLTLDGLSLWAQTHTDQLNHAGLPKSVNIKLVISHDSDTELSDNCPSPRDPGISPIL